MGSVGEPLAAQRTSAIPHFSGFSEQTLPLLNGTLLPGDPYLPSGTGPSFVRADPAVDRIFVVSSPAYGRPSLDSINSSSDELVREVPIPSGFQSFPPLVAGNGHLVVVGFDWPDELEVFNASSLHPLATIPLAYAPQTAAVDSATGEVFVVCLGGPWGSIVGEVNVSSDQVVRWDPVGKPTSQIVDDPANGFLYVLNGGSDNVSMINGSNGSLAATISVGHSPQREVVDPSNGTLYVLDGEANHSVLNLSVVNTSTDSVRRILPLSSPANATVALALDPSSKRLYVSLTSTDVITVVSTTNNTVVGNVTLNLIPQTIASDPVAGAIVVVYWSTGVVTFLSSANGSLLGNLSVKRLSDGFEIDPVTGAVEFPDLDTDQLKIVNASSRTFVANISVGLTPDGVLYDPFNGDIYVTETDQGGVTILNGSTKALVTTVLTGAGAWAMELCPGTDRIFVTNEVDQTVSVLNATTNSLLATTPIAGGTLRGMAWDPVDRDVFVGSWGTNVTVLNGTTGALVTSIGGFHLPSRLVFDPANREIYAMSGFGGPVQIVNGSTYRVVANITLGNGTPVDIEYEPATAEVWAVTTYPGVLFALSTRTNTIASRLDLPAPGIWGMAVEPTNATIVVSLQGDAFSGVEEFVNASSDSKIAVATAGTSPSSILFDERRGLALVANVESTNVTVLNLSTHAVVGSVRTGANPTNLALDPTSDTVYCTNNGVGTLTVLGPPVPYPVTVAESGLPPGQNWTASVDGVAASSTNSTVTIGAPNGTRAFAVAPVTGLAPEPAAGKVTVNGTPVSVSVQFVPAYPVVFEESGLPEGTNWSVSVGGATEAEVGSSIAFQEANGTYEFQVADVPGWRSSLYSGPLAISGTGATVRLNWNQTRFPVNFSAARLPPGESWAVRINETSYRAANGTIGVSLPNGSYSYSVAGAPGFAPVPASGSFAVTGSPVSQRVDFTTGYLVGFVAFGLLPTTPWSAAVNGSLNVTSGSFLGFEVPNGTFAYTIQNLPGWRASTYAGDFTVRGAGETFVVNWTRTVFPVIFSESGLPTGVPWSVRLNGGPLVDSNATTLPVFLPNGTSSYELEDVPGWRADAYRGNVSVENSSNFVQVAWSPVDYLVEVREQGLPTGLAWATSAAGRTDRSVGPEINWTAPNGTFALNVSNVPGWRADEYNLTVSVRGGAAATTVRWVRATYDLSFTATGLVSGAAWTVVVNGTPTSATGPTAAPTPLPNGTYSVFASSPGYDAINAPSSVTVAGDGVSIFLTFVPISHSASPTPWLIPIGLGGVLAAFVAAGVLLGRRRRRTPPL